MAGAIEWPLLAISAPVLRGVTFEGSKINDNSFLYIYLKVLYPTGPKMIYKKFESCIIDQGVKLKYQKLNIIFNSEVIMSCKLSKQVFLGMLLCHVHWLWAFYMFTCSYTYANGFLVIVVMRQLHVPDTCRTRAGHVRPSPINFLTSKTPVQSPRSSKLVQKHQRYGGPLNGPCLQNFMILDAFRYYFS